MNRYVRFLLASALTPMLLLPGCTEVDPAAPNRRTAGPQLMTTASVCAGNVRLATQAEVDAFACSAVTGDLLISHSSGLNTNISDLRPLASLTAVGGTLLIHRHPNLTSLAGLQNLTTLGGSLEITENVALPSLAGLEGITAIGGRLFIRNNVSLASLAGLGNLTTVTENVLIENTAIISLAGLEKLNAVGEMFGMQFNHSLQSLAGLQSLTSYNGWLTIRDNDALVSLAGLEALTAVDRLYITENDKLTSIAGLQNVAAINDLLIQQNPALTTLAGLEKIAAVSGDITLMDNASLFSLGGLANLQAVDQFRVLFNPALTSFVELVSLTSVGSLIVTRVGVSSLAGLERLTSIPGNVSIGSNMQLTSLAGLHNVVSIGGTLNLSRNDALPSLEGLGSLTAAGGLVIFDHAAMSSLTGVGALAAVTGTVDIDRNPVLTSLAGLETLTTIGNQLMIRENPALATLAALGRLESVGSDITIRDNPALASLVGLNALSSVGGSFTIQRNVALTSLIGLTSLASVGTTGHRFVIEQNDGLISLAGLQSLTSIAASLRILRNASLVSLTGLEPLVSTGSELEIDGNPALTSLAGLNNVTTVGADLRIRRNPALTSLAPLQQLTTVGKHLMIDENNGLATLAGLNVSPGGGLVIRNNGGLTSLAGLEATQSAGFVWIQQNAALASLDGLQNLGAVDDDLIISNNPALNACACGLAGLISGGEFTGVGGPITIENNAPEAECNSIPGVLAAPCSGNRAPVADAGADQVVECTAAAGTSVTLDGTGSSDPDGDPLTFAWSRNGSVFATGATPTAAFPLGTHTVMLTVDDGNGETSSDDVEITVSDTQAPTLTLLGANPFVVGLGGSYTEPGATASDACHGDMTSAITVDASSIDPTTAGSYEVRYSVTDPSGRMAHATRTVTVVAAPVITVGVQPLSLWPPNRAYHTVSLVSLQLAVSDPTQPSLSAADVVIAAVWSDEPEAAGADNTTDDIVIDATCRSVAVRAERNELGNGRVYTIELAVTNAAGSTGRATHQVFIPVGRRDSAVDDGMTAGYRVAGGCGGQ